MGYFPNGTSGLAYQEEYCFHCANWGDEKGEGCAIWDLHLLYNYDECNNKESLLHQLIPLDEENLCNKKCLMFRPLANSQRENLPLTPNAEELYAQWQAIPADERPPFDEFAAARRAGGSRSCAPENG